MSSRIPLANCEFRAFAQATEDESKVIAAIGNIFGEVSVERKTLEGYHGNPIILLYGKISNRKKILEFLNRLGHENIRKLLLELPDRMDEDKMLRFRLDKQLAFAGNFSLSQSNDVIDIALKFESFPSTRTNAIKVAQELLSELSVKHQES